MAPPERAVLLGRASAREVAASTSGVVRRFRTPGGRVTALGGVSLEAARGRLTAVAGPSGSGKSTLLGLIACLDRPDEGSVTVAGYDVTLARRRVRRQLRRLAIGLVQAQPSDNLMDGLDVTRNLHWAAALRDVSLSAAEVTDALAAVHLTGAEHKRIRQLSGGEQQRLAIAVAMVGDVKLIVADEPTASLDRANVAGVVQSLREVAGRGGTIVVASHDHHVLDVADDVIELRDGMRV